MSPFSLLLLPPGLTRCAQSALSACASSERDVCMALAVISPAPSRNCHLFTRLSLDIALFQPHYVRGLLLILTATAARFCLPLAPRTSAWPTLSSPSCHHPQLSKLLSSILCAVPTSSSRSHTSSPNVRLACLRRVLAHPVLPPAGSSHPAHLREECGAIVLPPPSPPPCHPHARHRYRCLFTPSHSHHHVFCSSVIAVA